MNPQQQTQNPATLALQQQNPNQSTQQPSLPMLGALAQQNQQAGTQLNQDDQSIKQNDMGVANQQQAISQAAKAMATLNPNANSKDAINNTMSKIGGALNTNNYSGLCLQYVDDQTGNKNRQPTAFADYQVNAQSGNIKTSGTPPKGARIYFAPTPDNPAGHIMLSNGNGTGTGATTDNGIQTFSIQDWEKYAGQQYIGYAPPGAK